MSQPADTRYWALGSAQHTVFSAEKNRHFCDGGANTLSLGLIGALHPTRVLKNGGGGGWRSQAFFHCGAYHWLTANHPSMLKKNANMHLLEHLTHDKLLIEQKKALVVAQNRGWGSPPVCLPATQLVGCWVLVPTCSRRRARVGPHLGASACREAACVGLRRRRSRQKWRRRNRWSTCS